MHTCIRVWEERTGGQKQIKRKFICSQYMYMYIHMYAKVTNTTKLRLRLRGKKSKNILTLIGKGMGIGIAFGGGIANFTFPTIPIRNEQCCAVRFRC